MSQTAPAVNTPAKPLPKITTRVFNQINALAERNAINLPVDYSTGNALTSAWLKLQEVQNKDQKNVFNNGVLVESVCTQNSVVNALHDMVVQGLTPAKEQCYFIVYGTRLTLQRSVHGDKTVAKRVKPGIEFYDGVVWKGDEFEFNILRGKKYVTKHVSKVENQGGEVVAAYCGVLIEDTGEDLGAVIMNMDEIKQSWGMSKTYKPEGGNTPHHKFTGQMALRTVGRRCCLPIIKTSSDKVLLESVQRQDLDALEAENDEEATEFANQEIISIPAEAASVEKVPTETVAAPEGEKGTVPAAQGGGLPY